MLIEIYNIYNTYNLVEKNKDKNNKPLKYFQILRDNHFKIKV